MPKGLAALADYAPSTVAPAPLPRNPPPRLAEKLREYRKLDLAFSAYDDAVQAHDREEMNWFRREQAYLRTGQQAGSADPRTAWVKYRLGGGQLTQVGSGGDGISVIPLIDATYFPEYFINGYTTPADLVVPYPQFAFVIVTTGTPRVTLTAAPIQMWMSDTQVSRTEINDADYGYPPAVMMTRRISETEYVVWLQVPGKTGDIPFEFLYAELI